jgi:hypothetical protein
MQSSHWQAAGPLFIPHIVSIASCQSSEKISLVTDGSWREMNKFATLNRRYLRISKNTTLEVRIYLHPDLIPTFTDDLLKVYPLVLTQST